MNAVSQGYLKALQEGKKCSAYAFVPDIGSDALSKSGIVC